MANPEWGTKRICPSCGARYYDLQKDPPVCPKCGTAFDPELLLKSRRARPLPAEDKVKAKGKALSEDEDVQETKGLDEEDAVETEETELDEVEDADDGDDDSLMEDTSELGEDEDDVGVEVDSDEDEDR